jgi:hypothetical protein
MKKVQDLASTLKSCQVASYRYIARFLGAARFAPTSELHPIAVLPEMLGESRLVVRNKQRDAIVDSSVLLRLVVKTADRPLRLRLYGRLLGCKL